MKFLRLIGTLLALGAVEQGCSSGGVGTGANDTGAESVGSVTQAISGACNLNTLGLPCDPDGPANPTYLECEGQCTLGTTGLVVCLRVKPGIMDNISCGTVGGVGNNACARHCSGRTCLASPASAGAACRPTSTSTPCDGQCDGAGHCTAVASACSYGRDEQLCKFATCDFRDATKCVNSNLRQDTLCSLSDLCALGKCNGQGTCSPSAAVGCDDGNACTDDDCDPDSGGCIGTNDDSNNCSDFNACTTGDFCQSGTCKAGTMPKDCNDGNACTADSCDPNTGCAHVAKSCDDGDACTDDSCDGNTGACSHDLKTCSDSNLCTTDSCNPATGCTFAPLNCDDADACTDDACFGGSCTHTSLSCDDNDACTSDACSGVTGCSNTPILTPECAPIGAGGAGGAAGSGGTDEGGASTGGTDVGGTSTGGTDVGGTSTGGTDVGGTSTGGTDVGGTSTGGTAGSSTSNGGDAAAGTAVTPTGGAPDETGNAGEGATGAHTVTDSGCGCQVPADSGRRGAGWALGLVAAVALSRRRRRSA